LVVTVCQVRKKYATDMMPHVGMTGCKAEITPLWTTEKLCMHEAEL
jgi:hypothetical protein